MDVFEDNGRADGLGLDDSEAALLKLKWNLDNTVAVEAALWRLNINYHATTIDNKVI